MIRAALLIAACAALVACDSNTDLPGGALNLDRPVGVAFACAGGLRITNGAPADITQPIESSAQPIASCDTRAQEIQPNATTPLPPGQDDLTSMNGAAIGPVNYFAFILESAPGTVALASWDATRPPSSFTGNDITVLDADPLVPGKNGISVGVLPIAIATDKVGCYEVTANAGSCDMTSLEINSAVAAATAGQNGPIRVDQLPVVNAMNQPVKAKPAAMVSEPAGGTIGVECPMQPTGLVYVAYPNCHTVALVDTSTGTVVEHIDFDTSGVATIVPDGNLQCANECGGEAVTPGTRPVALDLFQDTRVGSTYLAIGADNSNLVTVVTLDANSRPVGPMVLQIPLEQNASNTLGITQLALTPQIGMGGFSAMINDATPPGGQSQFVYAVATDGSVRVASILPSAQYECDAQVDPRYLHDNQNIAQLSCLQVGAPTTPLRRPNARGPGIRLVGDNFALSVMVFRGDLEPNDTRAWGPSTLVGYFGVITGSDGGSYVFNIDDDWQADFVAEGSDPTFMGPNFRTPLTAPIPMDIAHQLRDGTPDRDVIAEDSDGNLLCTAVGPDPDAASGPDVGTRAPVAPSAVVPTTYLGANKVNELPSIRQVLCTGSDAPTGAPVSELMFSAPVSVREQEFPDLRGTRSDETWTLTWQGPLSGDTATTANNGPAVRTASLAVDANGLHLEDPTGPFCNSGVQPYDIVQLRGCDPTLGDAECPEGYTCFVHPDSTVANLGACIATNEAARLADACREYLISLRRYTVGKATTGELLLLPRKHVLRTTPVDGCMTDMQCQDLANYAAQNASTENPADDRTPADTHTWSCQADPGRGDTLARCIETCQQDSDCIAGYVCQTGFCMEGVLPPQSCINAPQRFDLRANQAYTVVGTKTGYVHPIIADTSGNCIVDPNASRLQIGRIPLTAPACDPTSDPFTGQRMDGTFDPNPCSLTTEQTELEPAYQAGTCSLTSASTVLVTRTTDAIRFRGPGMTLTVVDPTYPGDSQCILDRGGTLGKIPLVDDLDQITFRQTSGLSSLVLDITPSFPVKALRGPGQSIWVVDEGDFLSTSIDESSTNGKVYRIESQTLSTVNLLQ